MFLYKCNNEELLSSIYLYFFFRSDFFIDTFISSVSNIFPMFLSIKKPYLNEIKLIYLNSLLILLNFYGHSFILLFNAFKGYQLLKHTFFKSIVSLLNKKKHNHITNSFFILNKSYYLKTFLDQTFSTLYYYFYITRLTHLKYNNILSYFSFLNLK